MKIYTKTGDAGKTRLGDMSVVDKDNQRVDLYGDIDELNAQVGVVLSFADLKDVNTVLLAIQNKLLALGSSIANPKPVTDKKAQILVDDILFLEKSIDDMEIQLQPLKNFILPGGHKIASLLHLSRTICRRVERKAVAFNKVEVLDPLYIQYLNRLSDYFFVAARYVNHQKNSPDVLWE